MYLKHASVMNNNSGVINIFFLVITSSFEVLQNYQEIHPSSPSSYKGSAIIKGLFPTHSFSCNGKRPSSFSLMHFFSLMKLAGLWVSPTLHDCMLSLPWCSSSSCLPPHTISRSWVSQMVSFLLFWGGPPLEVPIPTWLFASTIHSTLPPNHPSSPTHLYPIFPSFMFHISQHSPVTVPYPIKLCLLDMSLLCFTRGNICYLGDDIHSSQILTNCDIHIFFVVP